MSRDAQTSPRVLVTGASGYLGQRVIAALSNEQPIAALVATDTAPPPLGMRIAGVIYRTLDVRSSEEVRALFAEERPDVVVHLAAIVTPPKHAPADLAWQVDVRGTHNVLNAAVEHALDKLIVTSSGAAYGYHADNPMWLDEDAPIRGNEVFAYSHHKRLVEALLADFRLRQPNLRQLVLRPGTILGAGTKNQITALFERPVVLGLAEAASPFNFIWDEDVAAIITRGVLDRELTGIYNLAGDGVMSLAEIARALGKPYLAVPTKALRAALSLLARLHIGPYGPEQVLFLQHRPVLDNSRLVARLGFRPKCTRDVFEIWRQGHA